MLRLAYIVRPFAASFAALALVSCADIASVDAPRAPLRAVPVAQHDIVQSSGFYQVDANHFMWDGQVPVGDASPATISFANALAVAPTPEVPGAMVKGSFYYSNGDQGKLDLTAKATWNGTALINGSGRPGTWGNGCGLINWGALNHCTNQYVADSWDLSSQLAQYTCGVTVTAGGTAFARKTLPFGLTLGIPVEKFGSLPIVSDWGDASEPLLADTDNGVTCSTQIIPDNTDPLDGGTPTDGGGDPGSIYDPPPPDQSSPTGCTWITIIDYHYEGNDTIGWTYIEDSRTALCV